MISYERYLSILTQSDAAVRNAAESAFVQLLDKIRAGEKPQAALKAVLKAFNADAITGFREALNALLQESLGVAEIKAYKVGKVKLAAALYANSQAVSASAQRIIEKHLQGFHDARELRKALYEGYDFQEDPLDIVKPLPKYLQVEFDRFNAARLKTPALRAAYLQAIRQKEAGAGMEQLKQALKVAFYERNRYYANRIAQTELHRNYTDQVARELMAEDQIEYVQYRMSSKHPKADQCDAMAKIDRYGLGPGVFPKADAPKPPLHPFCKCVVSPKIDLFDAKPRFNPNAERKFLAALPPDQARQVAGSREKLERALKGDATLEAIYNEGKDPLYRWKRMGEVADNPAMPAFIRSSTVQQAEQEALKLGVKSADYQQSLDIANDVNDIFEQHAQKGGVLPDHIKIDPAIFVSWGQQYQFDPDRMPAAFWVDYQAGETHFYLNPASSYWNNKAAQASREHRAGYWSTGHADHPLWHELGHAMHHDNSPVAYQAQMKLSAVEKPIAGKVSLYAQDDVREFVAETFAALVQGKSFASDVLTLYQLYGGVLP